MKSLRLRFVARPRAYRGRLGFGEGPGADVHAGTFLRKREIVLDATLLSNPSELGRIFTHELFHFVWLRLGNPARRSYEELVAAEFRRGERGEMGWSSEWRKNALNRRDRGDRTRRWREYVCESFCDTAAWLFGPAGRHPEFTLAKASRAERREWFLSREELKRISV